MPRLNRPLKSWEIAARRRNAQESTGPRSREGKRRAALNSMKWRVCTKDEEERLVARGEDPREFRRLHRDLIGLLKPFDAGLDRLVGRLTGEFWEKRRLLAAAPHAKDRERWLPEINSKIELTLAHLVAELVVRTPSWYRSLTSTLGGLVSSPADLRQGIEGRLQSFGGAAVYDPRKGRRDENANLLKLNRLLENDLKTNLMLVSCALSIR